MSLPRLPARLPDDMAAALGQAIAGYGFLEEALKRAIYSLTLQGLGRDADERAIEKWLQRMDDIADDSLGTLIDSFLAAMGRQRVPGREALALQLDRIRRMRNLLCHASWRPGAQPGYWHPTFINTKGQRFPEDMAVADLRLARADTLCAARQVIAIMRDTGIEGEWAGLSTEDPDR